jgi:integron integrase
MPPPSSPPRLLDALRQQIRYLHYSLRTEHAYVHWVRAYIHFHELRHPAELSRPEVEAFLTWLANDRQVAPGTHKQALSALLFLYQKVLRQDLPWMADIGRPKAEKRLPVVLSVDEVAAVLRQLQAQSQSQSPSQPGSPYGLIGQLLYGTGMRLLEGLRLRVKDIDFDRRAVVVREGKGFKDRVVMLPAALEGPLRAQLVAAHATWVDDRARGLPGVFLPNALARKYPRAAESWAWQWVFTQAQPSVDPRTGLLRRHHFLDGNFQRAFKQAVAAAQVHKPASPHTLRHYSESRNMPSSASKVLAPGGMSGFSRRLNSAYSVTSQVLEEGHQLVVSSEASDSTLDWFDLVESCLLDVEIRIEIDLRCRDRLVAKPQRNHAAVGPRLQQFHGRRVAQYVRRDVLLSQGLATLACSSDVLGQQVLHAVCAQSIPTCAGKDDSVVAVGDLAQPSAQYVGRRPGQRRRSFLAALTEDPDVRTSAQTNGASTQTSDLRQTQSGLHGHEHECAISPACQGAQVRRAKQGIDLLAREKANLCPAAALAGHGQDPLNLCREVRQLERRIAKERANGSQPQVAAAGTDASTLLQVLQERGNERCIDLFELQSLGHSAEPLLREAQQLPKAVSVRGNRMGTALTLLHQPLGEKALQQRGQAGRGHDRSSQRRSMRAIASAMSCGCALRYQ